MSMTENGKRNEYQEQRNTTHTAWVNMSVPVRTLQCRLDGAYDALAVYRALGGGLGVDPTALLETACIRSREHTQSILMLSAALRIVCRGEQVRIQALNDNGVSALDLLAPRMPLCNRQGDALVRDFPARACGHVREEQQRLLHIHVMEPLREVLGVLKTGREEEDASTLLVGCFSFELFHRFEDIERTGDRRTFPDYEFYLADRSLHIDHQRRRADIISKVFDGDGDDMLRRRYRRRMALDSAVLADSKAASRLSRDCHTVPGSDAPFTTSLSDASYVNKVLALKQHVSAGDILQVVLARAFSLPCHDALLTYQVLRAQNPSPYMFFIEGMGYQLLGASPESAVKVTAADRQVSIYPIAGTRPRGLRDDGSIDPDLDARMEVQLRLDEKEVAEHMMLVDLARNDIARISRSGTRRLERLLDVDRYSHVMHLVSRVTGELKAGIDCFTAYRACMNMGTLTGAPKVRATQLIAQYEARERGPYGGAVGYINARGDMDTAIVIRSAVVTGGTATVSAGAGIVFDSDPQAEADETRHKALGVLRAIHAANQLHSGHRCPAGEVA